MSKSYESGDTDEMDLENFWQKLCHLFAATKNLKNIKVVIIGIYIFDVTDLI